ERLTQRLLIFPKNVLQAAALRVAAKDRVTFVDYGAEHRIRVIELAPHPAILGALPSEEKHHVGALPRHHDTPMQCRMSCALRGGLESRAHGSPVISHDGETVRVMGAATAGPAHHGR